MTETKPLPEHGTRSRYANPHRCRCSECRAAEAAYQREYRRTGPKRVYKPRKKKSKALAEGVAVEPRPVRNPDQMAHRQIHRIEGITRAEYMAARERAGEVHFVEPRAA